MSGHPWPSEAPAPAPGFEGLASQAAQAHASTPPDNAAAGGQAGAGAADAGGRRPPSVLIVGGSMGGCCAAVALGHVGCRVEVFEKAPGDLKSQGAGLVVQPDLAAFLQRYGAVRSIEEVCVRSAGRQYVDSNGRVIGGNDELQLFSAWDVLHRAVKARVPPQLYHSSSSVAAVAAAPGGVSITLQGGQQHSGDLLVGCDGPGSLVRRTFLPDATSEYQGYVAWRGLVPEQDLPQHVLEFIQNKFTVHQMPRSHILAYIIPGADGSTQPGGRRVNWVWYVNTPADSLPALFEDVHGHHHLYSVPRGLLRDEVAAERKVAARKELPPALADLVGHTRDVFVQAIHDQLAPRLALSDSCCLLGDAGCILRPHTAAGTTKAAVDATALAASLQRCAFQLGPALREYECSQLALARHLVDVGRSIGTRSQFPERAGQD
ncbi:hypothetical protein ABPG75_007552 [Micractinium tetrahymenae]